VSPFELSFSLFGLIRGLAMAVIMSAVS